MQIQFGLNEGNTQPGQKIYIVGNKDCITAARILVPCITVTAIKA